jgi:hypothetical protein
MLNTYAWNKLLGLKKSTDIKIFLLGCKEDTHFPRRDANLKCPEKLSMWKGPTTSFSFFFLKKARPFRFKWVNTMPSCRGSRIETTKAAENTWDK